MAALGLRAAPPSLWRLCRAAPRALVCRVPAARGLGTVAGDVLRSSEEGLLLLPGHASAEEGAAVPAARGAVLQHDGRWWVCTFEVDRYWFAAPLCDAEPGRASLPAQERWLCRRGTLSGCLTAGGTWPSAAVECLRRPTPTQAQRVPLAHGLPTGVAAVDVLAPLGLGQSLLVCGALGTGKSTLAREVLEHVLTTRPADRALRFCTDPCAPLMGAALHRAGALSELMATAAAARAGGGAGANLVAPLFAAVGAAEVARDSGENSLLVLDTVEPLFRAWDLAAEWAEAARGAPLDAESAATQRRALFAGLFERAAKLARGGSLTLLALADTDALAALAGVAGPAAAGAVASGGSAAAYQLADFKGRKASELERLQRLIDRGVPLSDEALKAVGIAPPSGGDRSSPAAQGSVMRELQSLSDGQIVLDLAAASAGDFPAVNPGATFSRFGLGSAGGAKAQPAPRAGHEQRDVRPPALQAVSAHLRTNLALEGEARFRPRSGPEDGAQSAHMRAVKAALLQPTRAPLQPEEMTALLLLACSGALSALPEQEAAAALRGGATSPLLLHLREAAPGVLRRMAEETQLSTGTVRELEVAARVFVALKQAGASKSQ